MNEIIGGKRTGKTKAVLEDAKKYNVTIKKVKIVGMGKVIDVDDDEE